MSDQFMRRIEDFVCSKCGTFVLGDGYTNHCPKCLYSKHVDINPGDRKAECGGMMAVVKVEEERGEWILTHRCEKCGHEKRNKIGKEDKFERVVEVAKKQAL